MYLTMKQQVKQLTKEDYKNLKLLSHIAKNLANEAIYNIRQYYFMEGEYLNYQKNYTLLKNSPNYKMLNSNMAQQILKEVDGSFKSFFGLLKLAKKGKYNFKDIKLPKYLPKDGFTTLVIGFVRIKGNKLVIPYSNTFKKEHKSIEINIPPKLVDKKIKEIRIIPKSKARFFEIQYIYEVEEVQSNVDKNKALAIDFGVNNLATCVEHAALDAPGDDQHNGTDRAASDAVGRERTSKDVVEHTAQRAGVGHNDHDAGHDVNHGHEGNQLLGNGAQTLDTAEEDDSNQNDQNDTQNDVHGALCAKRRVERSDHGVDGGSDVAHLHGVADAEGCQSGEDTEDGAQPLPVLAQTVLDVIHGAADPLALFVLFTELNGQQNFGVLGTHTDQGGDPQPEDGARAAQGDGGDDAGNVTGADGARQSGGHSLEGGDFALAGLTLLEDLAQGVFHCIAKLAELHALGHQGQQDAGAYQQDQHGRSPHDAIDCTINFSD